MTQLTPSCATGVLRPKRGGDEAAIQHYYDASNAFYGLWLDDTMICSCDLWGKGDNPKDLAAAQRKKLDYHLDIAGVASVGKDTALAPKGATGWGVLALNRLISDRYEG